MFIKVYKKWKTEIGKPIICKIIEEHIDERESFIENGKRYKGVVHKVLTPDNKIRKVIVKEQIIKESIESIKVNLIDYSADSLTCSPEACEANRFTVDSKRNEKILNKDNSLNEEIEKLNALIKRYKNNKTKQKKKKSLYFEKSTNDKILEGLKLLLEINLNVYTGIRMSSINRWHVWKQNNVTIHETIKNLLA